MLIQRFEAVVANAVGHASSAVLQLQGCIHKHAGVCVHVLGAHSPSSDGFCHSAMACLRHFLLLSNHIPRFRLSHVLLVSFPYCFHHDRLVPPPCCPYIMPAYPSLSNLDSPQGTLSFNTAWRTPQSMHVRLRCGLHNGRVMRLSRIARIQDPNPRLEFQKCPMPIYSHEPLPLCHHTQLTTCNPSCPGPGYSREIGWRFIVS